jgi:hypothetical protein
LINDSASSLSAWVRHLQITSGLPLQAGSPPPAAALRASRPGAVALDAALWTACAGSGAGIDVPVDLQADGPLHAWQGSGAIEVWTEVELSALHASWRLARTGPWPALRQRIERAMRWHLEHTQPDNATNRPWALHAFLLEGSPEGRAYAGTLLHNAIAMGGTPEPLSAWILMDAAAELDLAQASPRSS